MANLSLIGTASADTEYDYRFPAANANDGDTGTRWVSGSSAEHWLEIEWGEAQSICEAAFYCSTAGGESFSEYWIEHWDGDSWEEDIHVTEYGCPGTRTSHVVDISATKARIRMTSDGSYVGIYELEFMECEAPS